MACWGLRFCLRPTPRMLVLDKSLPKLVQNNTDTPSTELTCLYSLLSVRGWSIGFHKWNGSWVPAKNLRTLLWLLWPPICRGWFIPSRKMLLGFVMRERMVTPTTIFQKISTSISMLSYDTICSDGFGGFWGYAVWCVLCLLWSSEFLSKAWDEARLFLWRSGDEPHGGRWWSNDAEKKDEEWLFKVVC